MKNGIKQREMTKEICYNCGKYIDEYEIRLKKQNGWSNYFCLKCIRKVEIDREDILESSNGDY